MNRSSTTRLAWRRSPRWPRRWRRRGRGSEGSSPTWVRCTIARRVRCRPHPGAASSCRSARPRTSAGRRPARGSGRRADRNVRGDVQRYWTLSEPKLAVKDGDLAERDLRPGQNQRTGFGRAWARRANADTLRHRSSSAGSRAVGGGSESRTNPLASSPTGGDDGAERASRATGEWPAPVVVRTDRQRGVPVVMRGTPGSPARSSRRPSWRRAARSRRRARWRWLGHTHDRTPPGKSPRIH